MRWPILVLRALVFKYNTSTCHKWHTPQPREGLGRRTMACLGPLKPENESSPRGPQGSETCRRCLDGCPVFKRDWRQSRPPYHPRLVECFRLFPITLYLITAQHLLLHLTQNSVFWFSFFLWLDGNECGSKFYFLQCTKKAQMKGYRKIPLVQYHRAFEPSLRIFDLAYLRYSFQKCLEIPLLPTPSHHLALLNFVFSLSLFLLFVCLLRWVLSM